MYKGKRITRANVQVKERVGVYEGAKINDISDKGLDLILNGPTLNSVNKDTLRELLRELYSRCYQLENDAERRTQ